MALPPVRSKLLPVRGLKASLVAVVGELLEGEICYALDEDQYYQKEEGVLVSVGATKGQGLLADTALQPGDNISELVNDANYITIGEVPGDLVTSVNGETGDVVLTASDVGAPSDSDFSGLESRVATAEADINQIEADLESKADLVNGVVPNSQLPSVAITEYLGEVASEPEMLDLSGEKGDWCIRTDTGSTWVVTGADPSSVSSWTELAHPADAVTSVNGYQGAVVLNSSDVGATEEAPQDGVQYVRQDGAWAAVDVPPGTVVSGDAPSNPETGQQWYDLGEGRTFVWTGSEWVDASPDGSLGGGGDYVPVDGGNMTGNLTFNSDQIELKTDGSISGNNIELSYGTNSKSLIDGDGISVYGNTGDLVGVFNANGLDVGGTIPSSPNIKLATDGSITASGEVDFGGPLTVRRSSGNATPVLQTSSSGNVVIGPNGDIVFSDGSITAVGDIQAGDIDLASTTASGVKAWDVGQLSVQRDSTTADNVQLFRGVRGTTDVASIFSDGSAAFGTIDVSDGSKSGVQAGPFGALEIQRADGNGGKCVIVYGGTNERASISSDGSADFTGSISAASGNFQVDGSGIIQTNIKSAGYIYLDSTASFSSPKIALDPVSGSITAADQIVVNNDPGANSGSGVKIHPSGYVSARSNSSDGNVFIGTPIGAADATTLIKADGSAVFAASNSEIDATGQLTIKKAAPYTDPSFRILDRNNSNANGVLMYGDGSAAFGTAVNATNNNGIAVNGDNGSLNVYTTRYNTDCFQILNTSGSGANVAVKMFGNGSAEFAGPVTVGTSITGGTLSVSQNTGFDTCIFVKESNTVKGRWYANGDARFGDGDSRVNVYGSGQMIIRQDTAGVDAIAVTSGSNSNYVVNITSSGDATFAGNVLQGGFKHSFTLSPGSTQSVRLGEILPHGYTYQVTAMIKNFYGDRMVMQVFVISIIDNFQEEDYFVISELQESLGKISDKGNTLFEFRNDGAGEFVSIYAMCLGPAD